MHRGANAGFVVPCVPGDPPTPLDGSCAQGIDVPGVVELASQGPVIANVTPGSWRLTKSV